jgi:hypothetical protein
MQPTAIEPMSVASLRPYARKRTYPLEESDADRQKVERFGFTNRRRIGGPGGAVNSRHTISAALDTCHLDLQKGLAMKCCARGP